MANLDFSYMLELTSRHTTYNTVTGLAESVDNSDDPKVGSKHVSISFGKDENGIIDTIYIADDGKSMTKKEHGNFWSIEKTENFDSFDPKALGRFDIGGKVGPLSMGDTIELITKRPGGEIYHSKQTLQEYASDVEPKIETDEEMISLFNDKINGSSHGTLIIIKDLIDDYKITEDEFLEKDNVYGNFSLIYSGIGRIKHTIGGKEFKHLDIMGGIDTETGKRVMAKVYTQCLKIYIEGCDVPLKLITFHRYRNKENTIKWDVNNWGLFILRNGRLTTINPLTDYALFGDKGRSHRQMEFGAILYAESIHDKYLNMPFSKFISSANKFNASLIEQLSAQLQHDVSISADEFKKEGNELESGKLNANADKLKSRLNKGLQNFKKTAKYKKTTDEGGDNDDKKKKKKKRTKDTDQSSRPRKKRIVEFIKELNVNDFGEKSDLISVFYEGNNAWTVNVNTGHPLYSSMGLNLAKLECMIYYKLCMSMAIENTFHSNDERTYMRLNNNCKELDNLQESFVHEMAYPSTQDDDNETTFTRISKLKHCYGTNMSSEEVLNETDAEEPASTSTSK